MKKLDKSARHMAQTFKYSAVAVAVLGLAQVAHAQTAAPESNELVVTGFRAALAGALTKKKEESGVVDVIKAEDIGKFPDSNLAESLQRVPGIAIIREGGEGRSISVRGLNPDFTRVRINGMEALASWGNQDGPSRSRGFDFNIFASELFSEIVVRKTASADVDEGSLGATVDLRAARPFDFKSKSGPVSMLSVKGVYNDGSGKTNPRAAFLFSNVNEDKTMGVLFSGAVSKTNTLEAGFDTVRWSDATMVSGSKDVPGFVNTGLGLAANTVSTDTSLNKYFPRIPRYGQFANEQDRVGLTASLQAKLSPDTTVSLDMMYSKLDGKRFENWLEALSFSRKAVAGIGGTSIVSATYDSKNNLLTGVFNGVDIRTESRLDELSSTFQQPTLNFEHFFNDDLKLSATLGRASNQYRNPTQITTSLDAYNVQGYSIDFTGDNRRPVIGYGNLNVAQFGNNNCTAVTTCGLGFTSSTTLGDPSLLRMRQMNVDNSNETAEVNLTWDLQPGKTKVLGGASRKTFTYKSTEFRRTTAATGADNDVIPTVPTADYTQLFSGYGTGVGVPGATPTAWLVPNFQALQTLWDFNGQTLAGLDNTNARGATSSVTEKDNGVYGMLDFKEKVNGMTLRGNVGVRYVTTDLSVTGFTKPSATSAVSQYTVNNNYTDTLPSMNLALSPTNDVVVRLGAAKVMARPGLTNMNPAGSYSSTSNTLTSGNPFLKPYRAKSYDLGTEYYFDKRGMVGVGVFRKDIDSYIQKLLTQTTWSAMGLDPTKFTTATLASDALWTSTSINTPGGKLDGIELNYQQPFTFLEGAGRNFGSLMSYTKVNSKINYVNTTSTAGTTYIVDNLLGMAPTTWAATLYYEDDTIMGRLSVTSRASVVTQINPGNNNDILGRNPFKTLDASFSYKWDKQLTLTAEGVNLTNARDDQFVGRARDNVYRNMVTGRIFMLGARYSF
jgi:TonB-dependent receptor